MRLYAMQQNERNTALYEAILRLNSLDECIRFFDDLCAVTELRTMEQRYAVAGCLLQGKVYSEIRRETGASSATVSRVNRMLNYGTGSVAEAAALLAAGPLAELAVQRLVASDGSATLAVAIRRAGHPACCVAAPPFQELQGAPA